LAGRSGGSATAPFTPLSPRLCWAAAANDNPTFTPQQTKKLKNLTRLIHSFGNIRYQILRGLLGTTASATSAANNHQVFQWFLKSSIPSGRVNKGIEHHNDVELNPGIAFRQ
jgi:hypothetical protein